MKKAIFSFLCYLLLCSSVFYVYAIDLVDVDFKLVLTNSQFINTTTTTLSISGGQAIYGGSISGYDNITMKVKIELHLERKPPNSGRWTACDSYTKTMRSYTGAHEMMRVVSSTYQYQYRVRAVYTVWSNKSSESLVSYSGIVTY